MGTLNRYISILLLIVFGVILTPKELIHEFYGHEDTHCNAGSSKAFETSHHHCDILNYAGFLYTTPGRVTLDHIESTRAAFSSSCIVNPLISPRFFFNLRAPPLA